MQNAIVTTWGPQKIYTVSIMDRIGIRELKQRASAIVKRVAEGETVEITDYGHPVARLVPVRAGRLEQLVAEGSATGPRADLLDLADTLSLPLPAQPDAPAPSAALAELRAHER